MLAMRRILVPILLAALLTTAVGSYVQARRSDASADPGWIENAGPPETVVGTPMLSVRRTPSWLSAPVTEARLLERLSGVVALPSAPPQTCLAVYRDSEPVALEQADTLLVPSSLMTIVTAAAILEIAGPAATYTTEVFVRADALNAAADGALVGDIYLVGRGDPVLSTLAYVPALRRAHSPHRFHRVGGGGGRSPEGAGHRRRGGRESWPTSPASPRRSGTTPPSTPSPAPGPYGSSPTSARTRSVRSPRCC